MEKKMKFLASMMDVDSFTGEITRHYYGHGQHGAHLCPECAAWWACQANPCNTPVIAACPLYGCDIDWRVLEDVKDLPYWSPEHSMAYNLYPSSDFLHSAIHSRHHMIHMIIRIFRPIGYVGPGGGL